MLTELRITNFAVIEQLSLSVDSGFTVLTGETGTGKSLLIDAVALLVGGRASSDQIRFGEEEAQLEASFEIPLTHPLLQRLRDQGVLGVKDSQLVIRRVIARSGRNRVYLNGAMSPVHVLEDFGGTLIDIHGQHDQQSLLSNSVQLDAVDAFGRLQELRGQYHAVYREWVRCREERDKYLAEVQQRAQLEDLLKFQRQELDDAACRLGEEEVLQSEQRRLGASQRLGELAAEAQDRIQNDGQGILSNMVMTERVLGELVQIDSEMHGVVKLVTDAKVLMKEVADGLRDYAERLDADPSRLVVVEDRLALIQKMKRKYGGSIESVLEAQVRMKADLQRIEHLDEERTRYDQLIREYHSRMQELAQKLTESRISAAEQMTTMVRKELSALKMGQLRFVVQIERHENEDAYGPVGQDRAEFLLSANAGEPLRSMSRVASGGELSRVMLAVKSVLAEVDQVPVLIFDEIDTGVGGAIAASIGKRLRGLGRYHQVLCITHLPQVASQADHHLCVEKFSVKGRTATKVRPVVGVNREQEIARMLGGERVTQKVRETAAELLAGTHE